jgi:phosphomannomutase
MTTTYQIVSAEKTIFRAYDIRGIVDCQLNENVYFTLGIALAKMLKTLGRNQVHLAWDGRLTGPSYSKALFHGLSYENIEVSQIGLAPTALMYFATEFTEIDSGLMITGSHNPKDYNGLKIVLAGKTLAQDDIQYIYNIIQTLDIGKTIEVVEKPAQVIDMLEPYLAYILKDIKLKRKLKIVVDYGHGAGAIVGPRLFSSLNCEVISLYDNLDGHFPAHHPDPTIEENLIDLQQAVRREQADIGLAFDGDADRLGVVSSDGEIIWPDRVMMFFAREVLSRKPQSTIVYDVKCSKQLKDLILKENGQPIMSPTGHSLVKAIMKTHQAELAGEMSGHIFFKDRWFGFDDGIYSACRLLEILSSYSNMPALVASIPDNPVATPEIKIEISEHKKFNFMEKLKLLTPPKGADVITVDGIRLEFLDGWGLLRASNTSPCLVTRFEAKDQLSLKLIQTIFRDMILQVDVELNVPF